MGRYITEAGLKQLDKYAYKSGKYTWLDNAFQPYWEFMVTLVPMWVAPNLITFIGWLTFMSSTIIILLHDFTFQKNIPGWVFSYAAISLWTYSTLDAIDGKQARRTKTSSPLGQLFDHGCDSFCVTFLMIDLGEAAKLEDIYIFVLFLATYTAFWIANWKEYNTGVLVTNVGQMGVTESQIISCIIFIVSAIFGQDFWVVGLKDILPSFILSSLRGRTMNTLLSMPIGGVISYFFGIMIVLMTIYEVVKTIAETKSLKSLKELFSLFVLLANCAVWINFSFFTQNIGIILFSFGFLIAFLVCKLIVASVTKVSIYLCRCLLTLSTRSCCL